MVHITFITDPYILKVVSIIFIYSPKHTVLYIHIYIHTYREILSLTNTRKHFLHSLYTGMNNLDGKYLYIRPQFWGGTYNKVLGSSANDMLYYPRYKSVMTDANGKC